MKTDTNQGQRETIVALVGKFPHARDLPKILIGRQKTETQNRGHCSGCASAGENARENYLPAVSSVRKLETNLSNKSFICQFFI